MARPRSTWTRHQNGHTHFTHPRAFVHRAPRLHVVGHHALKVGVEPLGLGGTHMLHEKRVLLPSVFFT
eukprot:CAMPEP_0183359806 /NCGR_PEP_ID=MMETSP0164_2-20130417/53350_1 /TAXON_ID=221442 /ORGANISM="Coccolithus pelagicus ssp braarudi, Strain PLY182g" /LENGTH=67 /DNA_ID=CAMNT_0025534005 /DNA_START=115 /DNA_END=314 /DNA_ORIENTATION=+